MLRSPKGLEGNFVHLLTSDGIIMKHAFFVRDRSTEMRPKDAL